MLEGSQRKVWHIQHNAAVIQTVELNVLMKITF